MDQSPEQLRHTAAKYRDLAAGISDTRTFATLCDLAEDYERLADSVEADSRLSRISAAQRAGGA